MNRAERILKHARHEGWMCAVWISVACASGVWAAVAWMHGRVPGGALLCAATIAVLRLATWHWSERRRLREEMRWNPIGYPPRTDPAEDRVVWVSLAVAAGIPAVAAAVHLIWKISE